jgi:hypothetical protein
VKKVIVLSLILIPALPGMVPVVSAHGGGLNAQGCHNNRSTGDYHCHRGPPPNPRPNSGSSGRPFINCAEARSVGAAPVFRGDPRYGPHLDRDNDGIGCE